MMAEVKVGHVYEGSTGYWRGREAFWRVESLSSMPSGRAWCSFRFKSENEFSQQTWPIDIETIQRRFELVKEVEHKKRKVSNGNK